MELVIVFLAGVVLPAGIIAYALWSLFSVARLCLTWRLCKARVVDVEEKLAGGRRFNQRSAYVYRAMMDVTDRQGKVWTVLPDYWASAFNLKPDQVVRVWFRPGDPPEIKMPGILVTLTSLVFLGAGLIFGLFGLAMFISLLPE